MASTKWIPVRKNITIAVIVIFSLSAAFLVGTYGWIIVAQILEKKKN